MTNVRLAEVGGDLATLFANGTRAGLSDDELLARFVEGRGDAGAEAAFATIVARHGPMVRSACRRMLGDDHAADDAFQAVFLILARRAGTLRIGVSVGAWLHGVSVKVSARARSAARRRRAVGLDAIDPPSRPEPSTTDAADLIAAIDAEIARLPAVERRAVVLCHVQGLDQRAAARRLRCPLGTLQGRLHRGRLRLRSRLARRGFGPAVGLLSLLGRVSAEAALPASLIESTTRIAAGNGLVGNVPTAVALLTSDLIRRIMMKKVAWIAVGMVGLGGIGLAAAPTRGLPAEGPKAVADRPEEPRPSALRGRVDAVLADWDRTSASLSRRLRATKDPEGRGPVLAELDRAEADCARRLLDLAETDPADPAAFDAMVWLLRRYSRPVGLLEPQLSRAVDLLLAHRGDDPALARVACGSYIDVNRSRDRLVSRLLESARSHETKGLALLAKADYLVAEASRSWELKAAGSKPADPYEEALRSSDPVARCRQAEALFERALRDYGDVSAYRLSGRIPRDIKRVMPGHTMADEVANLLDELHGLTTGRPMPELAGTDSSGLAARLGDHRGKVVLLLIQGPEGPRATPPADLLTRMAGRPFVLIEVVGEKQPADKSDSPAGAVTWKGDAILKGVSGQPTPIRARPSALVLDDMHTIRFRGGNTPMVAPLVDDLVRRAEARRPATAARSDLPTVPSLRQQVDATIAELDRAWQSPVRDLHTDPVTHERVGRRTIRLDDVLAKYGRLLDLAETAPADPAALDATLCVIKRPTLSGKDDRFRNVVERAIGLILRHHADSPVAARVAMARGTMVKPSSDRLNEGLAESSSSRETKGLALLNLATYLEAKARVVRAIKAKPGPLTYTTSSLDPQGKLVSRSFRLYDDAYEDQLRSSDPEAMLLRAERLFERAAQRFGDINAYIGDEDAPFWKLLDRGTTVGHEASSRLDTLHGLEIGKPLPGVAGWDLGGKPARAGDQRGKVILLALGSGPVEARSLHGELVRSMKGRPFVLIQVVGRDERADDAGDGRLTWREATVPGRGGRTSPMPIWTVPSVLIVDAEGVLRFRGGDTGLIDGVVGDLVRKAEEKRRGGTVTAGL